LKLSADAELETLSASAEWRKHWPMVLAAFVGISIPVLPYQILGLFIDPLTEEFGWSRTLIALGGSIAALITIFLYPLVGILVDRWGSRRLAVPGTLLTGASIAAFGLANGSRAQWIVLWAVHALAAVLVKSTVWTSAVSRSFNAGRSLALAITLGGTALTAVLAPPLARWLTDSFGWREAYALIGFGWTLPAFLLCLLFLWPVKAHSTPSLPQGEGKTPPVDADGLSVSEALRSKALWRIALATFLTLLFSSTLLVHQVPLLVEVGVSRSTAAAMAGFAGLGGMAGGLVTGVLMSRFHPGRVAGITNGITALAVIPLLEPFRSPVLIFIGMVVVGYSGGTKLLIGSYLTGIHGGLHNYGKIYGVIASIIAFSAAIGPVFGGAIYDLTGSYNALILYGIPASLLAGWLVWPLSKTPDWRETGQAD